MAATLRLFFQNFRHRGRNLCVASKRRLPSSRPRGVLDSERSCAPRPASASPPLGTGRASSGRTRCRASAGQVASCSRVTFPVATGQPRWKRCGLRGARIRCSLGELLNGLQKEHSDDVALYTSGHLNPSKLYRPPETILYHWRNAHGPQAQKATGAEAPPAQKVAAMTDAWAYFTVHTALSPRPPAPAPRAPDGDALPPGPGRPREELRWPDVKVLRRRAPGSSRQCALAAADDDEHRYVSSHLAGPTRADKYRAFLRFQKEVVAKQDLLRSDLARSQAALCHEKKLEQVRGRRGDAVGTRAVPPESTCPVCVVGGGTPRQVPPSHLHVVAGSIPRCSDT